jgi:hypothetical protein
MKLNVIMPIATGHGDGDYDPGSLTTGHNRLAYRSLTPVSCHCNRSRDGGNRDDARDHRSKAEGGDERREGRRRVEADHWGSLFGLV